MKEKLNRLKGRWQRFLTRPREIALDLVLGAGLAFLCWTLLGYPRPFGWEKEFRRVEAQNLVSPSRVVYHQSRRHALTGEDSLTRDITVGLGENWAVVVQRGRSGKYIEDLHPGYGRVLEVPEHRMGFYTLEPGPQVLPVTWPTHGADKEVYGWTFLAVQLPEETAGGTLTLSLPDGTEQTLIGAPEEGSLSFWLADDSVDWPAFSKELDGTVFDDLRHDVWGRAVEEPDWMEGLTWTLTLENQTGEKGTVCSGTVPSAE